MQGVTDHHSELLVAREEARMLSASAARSHGERQPAHGTPTKEQLRSEVRELQAEARNLRQEA